MATWDDMSPAERDQLVAERVAGYIRHDCEPFPGHPPDDIYTYWTHPDHERWKYDDDELPRYSQDIGAAFDLLVTLSVACGLFKDLDGLWKARIQRDHETIVESSWGSLPAMICVAMLRFYGVDI